MTQRGNSTGERMFHPDASPDEDTLSMTRSAHIFNRRKVGDKIVSQNSPIVKYQPKPDENQPFIENGIADKDNALSIEAAGILSKISRNSQLFDEEKESQVTRFDTVEISSGKILGVGGFGLVSEVTSVNLKRENGSTESFRLMLKTKMSRRYTFSGSSASADSSKSGINRSNSFGQQSDNLDWEEEHMQDQVHDRDFISRRCIRNGDARYAIKTLRPDVVKNPSKFFKGMIDLAIEARFLAVIKHPNVIKMRAMSLGDPFKKGYFIILDRLYDTLATRMENWRTMKKKHNKLTAKVFGRTRKKENEHWIERILQAYFISSALKYLHSLNIVYRDLKPDNIGFDVRGDLKIFDFGLAKELQPQDQVATDMYRLSCAGSLRYMAPEVVLHQPYNLNVDVYSFAILLWEMCSLSSSFEGFSVERHSRLVVKGGTRPKIPRGWSPGIKTLLERSWSSNLTLRPNFEEVSDSLRQEISILRGDCDDELDNSGRSAKSH